MLRSEIQLEAVMAVVEAVNIIGGLVTCANIAPQGICACIGGVAFGIQVIPRLGEPEDYQEFQKLIERAGGKWVVVDLRKHDPETAVRTAVHYSTAQTRDNIDASIQHFCEHFGHNLPNHEADYLINLLTPGFRYDH